MTDVQTDVGSLKTDVAKTRSDLADTNSQLTSMKEDLNGHSTLIARNADARQITFRDPLKRRRAWRGSCS